ncbi:DUF3471 domain-containing protein [Pedobacter sp. NJ-S-72]
MGSGIIHKKKLANKQEIKNAFTPYLLKDGKPVELMGLPYGFAWMINEPQKFYIHTGGYPGYASLIVRYFGKGQTTIVLMNNYNRIDVYELGFNIENIINNREFSTPTIKTFAKVVILSAEKLMKFTGEYQFKDSPDFRYIVTSKNNQLFVQLSGQISREVYPETQNTFFYTAVDAKIVFTEDENGRVTKLTLKQNDKELDFIKI